MNLATIKNPSPPTTPQEVSSRKSGAGVEFTLFHRLKPVVNVLPVGKITIKTSITLQLPYNYHTTTIQQLYNYYTTTIQPPYNNLTSIEATISLNLPAEIPSDSGRTSSCLQFLSKSRVFLKCLSAAARLP